MVTNLSDNNLQVASEDEKLYDPVFKQILSDIPGGVTLKSAEFPADLIVLGAGTMVAESDTAGLYNVVKQGKSDSTQAASTSITIAQTANYKSIFAVGDYIAKQGAATAATITSVTQTSATQKTIVTGTAIGALATASIIIRLNAASTVVAATLQGQYAPVGFTRSVIKVREDDQTTLYNVGVGVVTRGEVNESKLPYVIDSVRKTALTDRFIYS